MSKRSKIKNVGCHTHGTIFSSDNFNAERSATRLRKALRGIGTDEKTIIEILTSNSNHQRMEVKKKYRTMYGREMVEDLKTELGGHFEDVCLALLMPPKEFLVRCLYSAVRGLGTNEISIIEILCAYEVWELRELKLIFKERFRQELESFLCGDLTGDMERIVRALVAADRQEASSPDLDLAELEAQRLFNAGVGRSWATNEEVFLTILSYRSRAQLQATFTAYEGLAGHSLLEAIALEFGGDLRRALAAVVLCMEDRVSFFAKQLADSFKGSGTDDETVIRVLVSRSEIDLADIKERFEAKYERPLSEVVARDTSGDYRKILLKILNP